MTIPTITDKKGVCMLDFDMGQDVSDDHPNSENDHPNGSGSGLTLHGARGVSKRAIL